MNKKAQAGGVIAGVIVLIIGIILLIGVAYPIVKSVVESANLTAGVEQTIGNQLGVFILIAGLLLVVGAGFAGYMAKR